MHLLKSLTSGNRTGADQTSGGPPVLRLVEIKFGRALIKSKEHQLNDVLIERSWLLILSASKCCPINKQTKLDESKGISLRHYD